jgi:hypothetical protein
MMSVSMATRYKPFEVDDQKKKGILKKSEPPASWDSRLLKYTLVQTAKLASTIIQADLILSEKLKVLRELLYSSYISDPYFIRSQLKNQLIQQAPLSCHDENSSVAELWKVVRCFSSDCRVYGSKITPDPSELLPHTCVLTEVRLLDCSDCCQGTLASGEFYKFWPYPSDCTLKSYSLTLSDTLGNGVSMPIANVSSHMSQVIHERFTLPYRLAHIAMGCSEIAVDSLTTLVEIRTKYKAPPWIRTAAKVAAVGGISWTTGQSALTYLGARVISGGIFYCASKAFSFVRAKLFR